MTDFILFLENVLIAIKTYWLKFYWCNYASRRLMMLSAGAFFFKKIKYFLLPFHGFHRCYVIHFIVGTLWVPKGKKKKCLLTENYCKQDYITAASNLLAIKDFLLPFCGPQVINYIGAVEAMGQKFGNYTLSMFFHNMKTDIATNNIRCITFCSRQQNYSIYITIAYYI